MVGLYLNSDGSLDKTQRICWMSMLFFTCGHTASLLKTHQRAQNQAQTPYCWAVVIWPQPRFVGSAFLTPLQHHHLVSHTLLPFGTGCFSFWNGWQSPIYRPLFGSNVTSSIEFLDSSPAAHGSHPRQSQRPPLYSCTHCILSTSHMALWLFVFISLPQTWELLGGRMMFTHLRIPNFFYRAGHWAGIH